MALGKSRVRMNAKAKGLLVKLEELTSGGALTTMQDLGYAEQVQIGDEHTMVDIQDATGDMINSLKGSRKCSIDITLLQSGKDELDLVANADGKFYHLYVQVQEDNPTVTFQEWYFPLVKIQPGYQQNFQAGNKRTVPIKIVALMPKGAVSVTPSGFNTAANVLFTMAETATTALGQVTTANGTIYTAAV